MTTKAKLAAKAQKSGRKLKSSRVRKTTTFYRPKTLQVCINRMEGSLQANSQMGMITKEGREERQKTRGKEEEIERGNGWNGEIGSVFRMGKELEAASVGKRPL